MTQARKSKAKTKAPDEISASAGPGVPSARKFIKFNASAREAFLKHLQAGKTKTEASEAIGIDRTTTYQYRTAHPEFEEQVRAAEIRVVEAVEDALYAQALKGNVKAQEIVLYNRASDRWADKGKREAKEESPPMPVDSLSAVLAVLDDHPDAKRELIRRMELMSE